MVKGTYMCYVNGSESNLKILNMLLRLVLINSFLFFFNFLSSF
jgi:hypothetical protein